jgi:hypothetical protein
VIKKFVFFSPLTQEYILQQFLRDIWLNIITDADVNKSEGEDAAVKKDMVHSHQRRRQLSV